MEKIGVTIFRPIYNSGDSLSNSFSDSILKKTTVPVILLHRLFSADREHYVVYSGILFQNLGSPI